MLENGDTQYDVETAARYCGQHVRQISFDGGDLRLFFQIRSQCRIDQHGSVYIRQDGSNETRLIAAAEVANFFSAKATRMLPDLIAGQPDAKPVDERRLIIFPVCPCPRAFLRRAFTSA